MPKDSRILVGQCLYGSDSIWKATRDGAPLRAIVASSRIDGGRVPLYARQNGLSQSPNVVGEIPLGYGFGPASSQGLAVDLIEQAAELPTGSGAGTAQDHLGSRIATGGADQVFSTSGSPQTVVTISPRQGGMVTSLQVDGVEMLNTAGGLRRGMHARLDWVDDSIGEFVRHLATTGGDRYSSLSEIRTGVVFGGVTATASQFGGLQIVWTVVPIEWDPDGAESIPFLSTHHSGAPNRPVWWPQKRVTFRLWLDHRGVAGRHQLSAYFSNGDGEVLSGWFDMAAFLPLCFDADRFSRLIAYDVTSSTQTVISTGTAGVPGYQVDGRRYVTTASTYRGDDEASPAASLIPSGFGGLGVAGAADTDPAVLVAQRFDDLPAFSGVRSLLGPIRGNGFGWMQDRSGTGGPAGSDLVMVAPGSWMTNLIHPSTDKRRMPAGVAAEVHTFLCVGDWTGAKALADDLP